jgi:transcription initiation factor IIE alpha subunit
MEIQIPVSDQEKKQVINAIKRLNAIGHLQHMSQAMIANSTGIKATKIRVILAELIKEERITQYVVTQNKSLQRYYYIINDTQPETKEANGVKAVEKSV